MAFFIEKIVASGAGKKESTIVFKPGANIIYGPSNTGKTYIVKCIDFLFGSDADPFDSSSGYDSIVRNLQFSTFPQGDANRIVAVVLTSQQYASYNARKFL